MQWPDLHGPAPQTDPFGDTTRLLILLEQEYRDTGCTGTPPGSHTIPYSSGTLSESQTAFYAAGIQVPGGIYDTTPGTAAGG